MPAREVRSCGCPACQQPEEHAERAMHRQMLLLFSRLDEQQRRWFAALEANRRGHGGETTLAQMTGLDAKTIQRGRRELASSLASRPTERVRLPGGGRLPGEKKTPRSAAP